MRRCELRGGLFQIHVLIERDGEAKKSYGEVLCGVDSPRLPGLALTFSLTPPTPNSLGGWQLVDREAGGSDPANHYMILAVLSSLCTPSTQNSRKCFWIMGY